jgi:hypothetical protein
MPGGANVIDQGKTVTITGDETNGAVVLDASHQGNFFRVNGDKAVLVLQGLALQNGLVSDSGSQDSGGATSATAGALQAKSCVFARNVVGNGGGAAINILDGTRL